MNADRFIFSQIMDFLPMHELRKCIANYQGNRHVKTFSCVDQFYVLAFAQLTYRESLRDIETCLRSMQPKLYHMGIRGRISRSTLAEANEQRNWKIYQDFAHVLIQKALPLYANEKLSVEISDTIYALDSTVIDLCLSLFSWAQHRKNKSAVKMHTLLNVRGSIPTFIEVTSGSVHDVHVLDQLHIEPGAIYVMDRAYMDFARLFHLNEQRGYFVTRTQVNLQYKAVNDIPSNKANGVLKDNIIMLTGPLSRQRYPEKLRRVHYYDAANDLTLILLTNRFDLSGHTIAELYRLRWQIELFFKWIKQHLRIKGFYGNSPNAVKTQIWISISVYLLVAIVRKELKIKASMHTIMQILSLNLFEKTPIIQAMSGHTQTDPNSTFCEQLNLLDF